MFRMYEYNKTRNMPIAKAEQEVVEGDILVLDGGLLRKLKATDTITKANYYAYYFCNENKKCTVDANAPVQYVGAIPFDEKMYGTMDLNFDAECGTGITIKSGALAAAASGDFVFATAEKDNSHGGSVAVETRVSTYGSGYAV